MPKKPTARLTLGEEQSGEVIFSAPPDPSTLTQILRAIENLPGVYSAQLTGRPDREISFALTRASDWDTVPAGIRRVLGEYGYELKIAPGQTFLRHFADMFRQGIFPI